MKDRIEMMDLLGTIVFLAERVCVCLCVLGGTTLVYMEGKKAKEFFLSYSFENKLCGTERCRQAASGCGVYFVFTK